ncbi:MAG TPA: hypothetical protein VK277_09835 [Acidimicrobiales bacterium]|nr:hypothetical protein [Acidimicrobiales bacterium]
MPDRVEGLPLQVIRNLARIHLASGGQSDSNLYVSDAVYRRGEVLLPGRGDIVVPRDSVIVFADDEPLQNWGHECRYLLHDPESGELTGEIDALLPPTLDFGRDFVPFHVPTAFGPPEPLRWPIVYLPEWLFFPEWTSHWYVILYSGASMNRHLNDMEFLYRTLVNTYGVPAENITVLNFDGSLTYNDADWTPHQGSIGNWPGDNTPYQIQIDGPGTRDALVNAIAEVGTKLGPDDNLLLHTNNHGNTVSGVSTIISYSGADTTPDDVSNAVGGLPKFSCFMVMMEQCYSGGFIQPIIDASPASCTSVATAVDANHTSAGGPEFDPFALDWIEAMAGTNPDGTTLSPAAANGPPTAQEAFDYALATDTEYGDDPQFESSGGGENCTLARSVVWIPIPPLWRFLFPWQILPDPSPERISELSAEVTALVASGELTQPLAEIFQSTRVEVTNAVRERLSR